jgi:hypothetical protein
VLQLLPARDLGAGGAAQAACVTALVDQTPTVAAAALLQENTKFLPFLSEMTDEQFEGEFAWATFPGACGAQWGGRHGRLRAVRLREPRCFVERGYLGT